MKKRDIRAQLAGKESALRLQRLFTATEQVARYRAECELAHARMDAAKRREAIFRWESRHGRHFVAPWEVAP